MPYIGRPLQAGVRRRYIYAATAGQTSFSGNDSNGISLAYDDSLFLDVYQNGVLLKPVTDYTSTTGTSVVLTTGASTDDVLEMLVFDTFGVADTVSAKDGGSFAGAVSMASTLGVTGAATLSSTLAVTGATTLTGEVTESQASVDLWRLSAHYSSSGTTITGWERPDDGYSSSVNGLTESSGVFTWTKTGLYLVNLTMQAQNNSSADSSFGVGAYISTNSGGAYDQAGVTYNGDSDTGTNNGAPLQIIVNVSDISTYRMKFIADSLSSGTFISGNTDQNMTCFSCIKLAPAQ